MRCRTPRLPSLPPQHPFFDPVREGLPGFKPLPEPMAQMLAALEARRRQKEQAAGDDGDSGSSPRMPAAAPQEAMAVA